MGAIVSITISIVDRLLPLANKAGEYFGLLGIRLLLAYEFGEAGAEKLRGSNWFAHVKDDFPFPFNTIPVQISWFFATWFELIGAVALMVGLFTRFFAVSLAVLTAVAWMSVHADHGYNVCQNGFKLPLIFLVMLIPLILSGPGRLALDRYIWERVRPGR
jgi:putative oxidoreductase